MQIKSYTLKTKGGSQAKNPVKIANHFNYYFTSVANETTKRIPRNLRSPLSNMTNPNQRSFFIFPCISHEVSVVITFLKNGKSSGPNSFPMKLLKILVPQASDVLSNLISEAFETSIFPEKPNSRR